MDIIDDKDGNAMIQNDKHMQVRNLVYSVPALQFRRCSGRSRSLMLLATMQAVYSLLQLDEASMRKGICTRLIVAGGESMVKQENAVKAKQCRDALAKALYSRLFDNVVKFVNSALRIKGTNTGSTMQVGTISIALILRD
jgi:myosin heavy subunit